MDNAEPSTWADYRRLSCSFWVVLSLGLAATLVIAARFLVERYGIHGLAWPLVAWLAVAAYAGWRLQAFRCPRCNNRFFDSYPPLLAIFDKRCANCMLPKE